MIFFMVCSYLVFSKWCRTNDSFRLRWPEGKQVEFRLRQVIVRRRASRPLTAASSVHAADPPDLAIHSSSPRLEDSVESQSSRCQEKCLGCGLELENLSERNGIFRAVDSDSDYGRRFRARLGRIKELKSSRPVSLCVVSNSDINNDTPS